MLDGDAIEAMRFLDRAVVLPDDGGEALFARGLLLIGLGMEADAVPFLQSAIDQVFPSAERLPKRLQLATMMAGGNRYAVFQEFYDGFSSAFCVAVACRSIRAGEAQGYAFCMDRLCAFLGWLRPAIPQVLRRDEAINGASYWSQANLGHQFWITDDRVAADAAYGLAKADAIARGIAPYHFNCGVLVWLPLKTAEALDADFVDGAPQVVGDVAWNLPSVARDWPELVISVGCDRGYFRYFPKLLLSIRRAHEASGSQSRFLVHCHVADASDEQIRFFSEIGALIETSYPHMRLVFSHGAPAHRERSYYTCLRFLTLPTLLQTYDCGVLVLDIDCILHEDFFANIRQSFEYKFGMRKYNFDDEDHQMGGEPWSITAYPLYISNTLIGRRLASFIVRYIEAAYDPGLVTNWTIDQSALGQAHRMIAQADPEKSILNLARSKPLVRFPHEFGSKDAFLVSGGITTLEAVLESFRPLAP